MGALIAPVAWLAGVAAGAWAWSRLCPAPPGSPLARRLAEPLLAGWVIEGTSVLLLALCGAAASPAAALAPVALALVAARRPVTSETGAPSSRRPGWTDGALLAIAAGRLGWLATAWPWGQPWGWDFYAVWGLKARYLVGTGGLWRYMSTAPSLPFSHAEYPLLLPAHLAAVSWPAGSGFLAALPDAVLAGGRARAVVGAVARAARARAGGGADAPARLARRPVGRPPGRARRPAPSRCSPGSRRRSSPSACASATCRSWPSRSPAWRC